jgi:hypothetical protein
MYLFLNHRFLFQEPLNSGDDVSEEDPSDLFETDNVVVCQYDKVITQTIVIIYLMFLMQILIPFLFMPDYKEQK